MTAKIPKDKTLKKGSDKHPTLSDWDKAKGKVLAVVSAVLVGTIIYVSSLLDSNYGLQQANQKYQNDLTGCNQAKSALVCPTQQPTPSYLSLDKLICSDEKKPGAYKPYIYYVVPEGSSFKPADGNDVFNYLVDLDGKILSYDQAVEKLVKDSNFRMLPSCDYFKNGRKTIDHLFVERSNLSYNPDEKFLEIEEWYPTCKLSPNCKGKPQGGGGGETGVDVTGGIIDNPQFDSYPPGMEQNP